jgi:hypothetical protein
LICNKKLTKVYKYDRAKSLIEEISQQELLNNPDLASDDLSDRYTRLAIANAKLQNSAEALRYFKLHKQTFGANHSNSIKIAKYFINNNVDVGM